MVTIKTINVLISKEQETQPPLCLGKTESIIINLDDESLNNMNEWCIKQHGASGLTQACRESKVSCAEAERMVLDMVARHTVRGQCPLAGKYIRDNIGIVFRSRYDFILHAGTTVSQDRRFIDKYMPDLGAWVDHRTVDTTTIKELTRRWYPEVLETRPEKNGDHRALGDIEDSIKELQYYRENVFK